MLPGQRNDYKRRAIGSVSWVEESSRLVTMQWLVRLSFRVHAVPRSLFAAPRSRYLSLLWLLLCLHLLAVSPSCAARTLGDSLFSRLNLNAPGLEQVRDAVQRRDSRGAEQALLDYYRGPDSRRLPDPPPAALERERVLGRARAVLNHDLSLLTRRVRLGKEIDWRASAAGDPEWTRALNRHEFLDDLTAAYRLTGDEQYARELDALISNWIRANPVPEGPGNPDVWREMEAGTRAAGPWRRAWAALQESASFRAETRLAMLRSFSDHAQLLLRSNSGRHEAIAAASGLLHVAVLFPEFTDAPRWRQAAMERLEAAMRGQVLPDGGQLELSTQTHQVALRHFAQPLRLLLLDPKLEFSDAYLAGISRMLRWNVDLARPDGTLPQLNEADRVTVARRPEWVETLADVTVAPIRAAMERWQVLEFADRSAALLSSGLFIVRDGEQAASRRAVNRYLCIDAGASETVAGHQDRLSLDLWAFGRSLLIDPGRYLSTDEGAWFRGPMAHHTILVEGQGQTRPGAAGEKEPPVPTAPRSAEPRWFTSDGFDFFEGSYDGGFGPSRDRAIKQVRQVLFVNPFYWVVWDRLAPDLAPARPRRFEQLWHFAPGRVAIDEARRLVATADEGRAGLALLPVSAEAAVRVVEGGPSTAQADLIQGWYSPEYGVREAAPVAVYRQDATPPVLFETLLYPYAAGRRPAFGAERVSVTIGGAPAPAHQVSAFDFRYGLSTDRILMTHDPDHAASLKQAGDLRTDAELLILRSDTTGRPARLLARGVSSVTLGDRILFTADHRQDAVDRTFPQ
jgi:hypothetical protein